MAQSQLPLLSLREWADDDSPGEYVDGHRTDEEVPTFLHDAIASWLMVAVYLRGSAPSRRASLLEVPPFIGVEVLSPSHRDQVRDRVDKLFEYVAFGIRF
jgi:hypothetical protein